MAIKIKNTVLLIYVGSSVLLAARAAYADPVQLVAEDVTDANAAALGLSVCQVSVQFDSAADNLLSAAFSDITTDDPAGFHQHPLGSDTAPGQLYVQVFPELAYDSFVTIGLAIVPTGVSDSTALDPDWDSSSFNNSGQTAGGWYSSNPDNTQGVPDANLRVLIGQFTSTTGYNASGNLTVYYNDGTVGFAGSFTCSGEGASGAGAPEGSLPASPAGGAPEGGCMGQCPPGATRLFVDANDGALGNDCSSWDCACRELQTALDCATANDEIWVAVGKYRPDFDVAKQTYTWDRFDSFEIPSNVAVYGGFEGTEESLSQRVGLFEQTILTGDLMDNDNITEFPYLGNTFNDNSLHVVTLPLPADPENDIENVILDGFKITGGYENEGDPAPASGGGLFASGITINTSIANCFFEWNFARCLGGAVHLSGEGSLVRNCKFRDNVSATGGGGLRLFGDGRIDNCEFARNQVVEDLAPAYPLTGRGGGLFASVDHTGQPEIPAIVVSNTKFEANQAADGGGAHAGTTIENIEDYELHFVNCSFTNNIAGDDVQDFEHGGAMTRGCRPVSVTNCLFVNNCINPGMSGSFPASLESLGGCQDLHSGLKECGLDMTCTHTCAPLAHEGFKVTNSTIVGCPAIEDVVASKIEIRNSILWDGAEQINFSGLTVCEMTYSNINGGYQATDCEETETNINQDPLFGPAGDYRIQADSPCIDAGDNTMVPPDVADLDKNGDDTERTPLDLGLLHRFKDDPETFPDHGVPDPPDYPFVVDMGAYEFQRDTCPALCPGDATGDGLVNATDLAWVLGAWGPCPTPCPPDPPGCTCPADLNDDCLVGAPDLAFVLGAWGPCP